MSRPELPEDLEVFVESIDEQGRATYISGFFEFKNSRFKFDAIAMDGYGGPNVAATLAEETTTALRCLEVDDTQIDELITILQRKIMEGGAHVQLRKNQVQEASDENAKTP